MNAVAMPKNAATHIQNNAPGPPTEIAPVMPTILPGPARIASPSMNDASALTPVFDDCLRSIMRTILPTFIVWMKRVRIVK